ncbi:MAG: helix-turn-helix transcriptional regulator [Nocardioidaceae bacterium]
MSTDHGPDPRAELAEVPPGREIQRLASDLRRFVEDAVYADVPRPDVQPVGVGPQGIQAGFERLERRTRSSVWNMQRNLPFDPNRPGNELDERSRRRGVELRLVVSPIARRLNPLLPCVVPTVRLGPVPLPMLVIDEAAVVLPGPPSPQGEWTVWLVTNSDVARSAVEVYASCWAASSPWNEAGRPPLTERQFAVACLLSAGLKDDAIARQLRVSRRTVVAEVEVILGFLGARSRFEAGSMIRGSYV